MRVIYLNNKAECAILIVTKDLLHQAPWGSSAFSTMSHVFNIYRHENENLFLIKKVTEFCNEITISESGCEVVLKVSAND